MHMENLAAGICFLVIIAFSTYRLLTREASIAQPSFRTLKEAHDRFYDGERKMREQAADIRAAWISIINHANVNRPVTVMLEAKLIDRLLERADEATSAVKRTSTGLPRMTKIEIGRLQAQVYKQLSVLNSCQADLDRSLMKFQREILDAPDWNHVEPPAAARGLIAFAKPTRGYLGSKPIKTLARATRH